MDPQVVLIFTWALAGLVVAAYIWFVVWRFRVERRKKEAEAVTDAAMSEAIVKTAEQLSATRPMASPSSPVGDTASTAGAAMPPQPVGPPPKATVAGLLSGIALPHDLVPLTTIAPRHGVGDRVAFWTDRAPAEVVGPAFADELERLGFSVVSLDERTLEAQRADDRVLVMVHPDGDKANIGGTLAFSTVPERSVVIEAWVPA